VTSEEEYALDNYGTCDREADCYWGKDAAGRFDGCLRVGWRGRDCPHWHPKPAQNGLRAGPARLQGAFLGLAAPVAAPNRKKGSSTEVLEPELDPTSEGMPTLPEEKATGGAGPAVNSPGAIATHLEEP
jgi:hypothetical protein